MTTKRFGLILVGLVSFLLGMEGAVRIEDWIRYGTPPFVDAVSQADLIVTDSLGTHGKPNGRFRKWKLNSLGYRGPEITLTPSPGTVRIVTTGASETFGLVEDNGKEFPRQLQDSLNGLLHQLAPTCTGDVRFEVVNAALPGMYLPTAIADVRRRLKTVSPAAVLYYPTPHQYLDIEPPRAYAPGSGKTGEPSPFRPFYPRSIGRIRDAIKGLLPTPVSMWLRRRDIDHTVQAHPPGWRFTSVPEDRLDAFESDARRMVGAVRSIGAIPVLATHANKFGIQSGAPDEELLLMWQRFSPRSTGATLIAFDSAANRRLERVAGDSAVLLIHVDQTLYASGVEGLFGDYVHFTDAGSSFVAEAAARPLYDALIPPRCLAPEADTSTHKSVAPRR